MSIRSNLKHSKSIGKPSSSRKAMKTFSKPSKGYLGSSLTTAKEMEWRFQSAKLTSEFCSKLPVSLKEEFQLP